MIEVGGYVLPLELQSFRRPWLQCVSTVMPRLDWDQELVILQQIKLCSGQDPRSIEAIDLHCDFQGAAEASAEDFLSAEEVAVDNADVATCGFLTNAKVESVLAKPRTRKAVPPQPHGAELGRSQIAGRRFEVSNNVPSNPTKGSGTNLSTVIYGNFADLLICMFASLKSGRSLHRLR